jgi:hypothetical protein
LDRKLSGPKAGLDKVVKRKIPILCQESNLPIIHYVLSQITLTRMSVPLNTRHSFPNNNLPLPHPNYSGLGFIRYTIEPPIIQPIAQRHTD